MVSCRKAHISTKDPRTDLGALLLARHRLYEQQSTQIRARVPLNELLKRNVDNHGILPQGTHFDQGPSHGSGCSATSTSQTLRAAFTAYLGFRHARLPNGERYDAEQAFAALGIHLGDDGLDADLSTTDHSWAARKVGLVLEAGSVCRGDRGVTFLARYYSPDVWNGRTDSMCDIKRQLSKFHTTLRLPFGVSAEAKLVEKAMGFVATDGNTPIIGELCQKAVALSDDGLRRTNLGIQSWWAQFDTSVQFPNCNDDGWMDAELCAQFPEFDHGMFVDWLVSVRELGGLLRAPLCADPKPATPTDVPVVVDEDVLPAAEIVEGTRPTSPQAEYGPPGPPTTADGTLDATTHTQQQDSKSEGKSGCPGTAKSRRAERRTNKQSNPKPREGQKVSNGHAKYRVKAPLDARLNRE